MELNVKDRLLLLSILPKEGNITTLKIVRKLREDLSFSEEEHKAFEIKIEGNMTLWNQEKAVSKNIDIGEKANDVIVEALNALSKNSKLREEHLPIWDLFVEA